MTIHLFGRIDRNQKKIILKFSRKICSHLKKLHAEGEIYIVFVSDDKIRNLKCSFWGKNMATDVIAFNYNLPSKIGFIPKSKLPWGDIFISLDTARRQSVKGKYPLINEIALLILHGLLHLIGYEDSTSQKRNQMFAMQKKLFRKVEPSLAPPDFR